ncbi:MAG: fluoride efflux transporter CrcB [Candidatus Thermoplasmatota archaeon]|nr:fluoride efflux transporter CrcB [Candidatus Thermoplasmatota archaeon]
MELRFVALVAAGSATGGVMRYLVSGALTRGDFPWGTFAVNFTGTFLLTLLFFMFIQGGYLNPDLRTFLFIGVFGGYTTFSTFGLETTTLIRESQFALAGANILLNAGLCLAGGMVGAMAGTWLGGT